LSEFTIFVVDTTTMTAKIQDFKSKRQKILMRKEAHRMSFTEKVATVSGCSPSMVNKVLGGSRKDTTTLGERIQVSATLIAEKENLLIQEIKRIVNL
jgi:hypothetical protein